MKNSHLRFLCVCAALVLTAGISGCKKKEESPSSIGTPSSSEVASSNSAADSSGSSSPAAASSAVISSISNTPVPPASNPPVSSKKPASSKPPSSSRIPSSPPASSSKAPVSSVPSLSPPATSTDMAQEVIRLCNIERAKAGLAALAAGSSKLQQAANLRTQEIMSNFSHTRPNGSSCFTVFEEFGISYRGVGENIAKGQRSAEAVVNAWMNSEGHRANILNANYTTICVGFDKYYWVQLFMR